MGLGVVVVVTIGVYAGVGVAAGPPVGDAPGSADGVAFAEPAVGDGAAGAAAAGAWVHDRSWTLIVVVALMWTMSAWASAISVWPREAPPINI